MTTSTNKVMSYFCSFICLCLSLYKSLHKSRWICCLWKYLVGEFLKLIKFRERTDDKWLNSGINMKKWTVTEAIMRTLTSALKASQKWCHLGPDLPNSKWVAETKSWFAVLDLIFFKGCKGQNNLIQIMGSLCN